MPKYEATAETPFNIVPRLTPDRHNPADGFERVDLEDNGIDVEFIKVEDLIAKLQSIIEKTPIEHRAALMASCMDYDCFLHIYYDKLGG